MKHVKFKKWYIIGIVLGMALPFWLPCLIACIKDTPFIIRHMHKGDLFYNIMGYVTSCILALCISSFTMPVTVPLSSILTMYFWPIILQKILFTKELPFNDYMYRELLHHNMDADKAAVLTGTIIGKFL